MNTTVGAVVIEIVEGDIAQLEVDAIVNAANNELWMGSGVAGAIKRAGGETIEKEAMVQGPIAIGEAVATTGGSLKAQWVIHAAVMGQDLQTDGHVIALATASALAVAERCRVHSIALPAFGTGMGGFPLPACATVMMGEVRRYIETHPKTGLRRVVLCVHNEVAKAAFANAIVGMGHS